MALCAPSACDADPVADAPADPEDGMFTGPKADGFCAEPGSPEALGILALVNDEAVDFDELDRPRDREGAGLNALAARSIVERRPFATLAELDAAPWVGTSACGDLLEYACDVKGLCEPATCDPDSFPDRPARTGYDSGCESILLAIAGVSLVGDEQTLVTDGAARCETLTDAERAAFDAAAAAYRESPRELTEFYGEFSVSVFETVGESITVAHVIEEDSFSPFHVVMDGGSLAAVWVTDGLSAGVDWYCGGREGAHEAAAPDEWCVGAITDDVASCADADLVRETLAVTVAEARADFLSLAAAAATEFADANGLDDSEALEVEVERCAELSAEVVVRGAGQQAEFRVVDSTRGLGRTVLTQTVENRTELLCGTPNG